MTRRPPRSTLFPYRRSSDLARETGARPTVTTEPYLLRLTARLADGIAHLPEPTRIRHRSEEHTSELQSHHDLVCRLLLEKKKIIMRIGTSCRAKEKGTSKQH